MNDHFTAMTLLDFFSFHGNPRLTQIEPAFITQYITNYNKHEEVENIAQERGSLHIRELHFYARLEHTT